MPAGGERPGPWALLWDISPREGMKPYSAWPKRQKEGKTVLGRGRTHQLGCSVLLPGGSDVVGRTALGVLALCPAW